MRYIYWVFYSFLVLFRFISWAESFIQMELRNTVCWTIKQHWLFQFFWIIANLAVDADVRGSKCAFREWFYIVIFVVFLFLSFFLCFVKKDTKNIICLRTNYITFWLCAIKKHKIENGEKNLFKVILWLSQ